MRGSATEAERRAAGLGRPKGVFSATRRDPGPEESKGTPVERVMHGFHASDSQCSYGLTMHLVSFALAGIILGAVLLIR